MSDALVVILAFFPWSLLLAPLLLPPRRQSLRIRQSVVNRRPGCQRPRRRLSP
jgi:hypothetical protein